MEQNQPTGYICYGFKADGINQTSVNKEHAEIISLIYERYLEGFSLSKISNLLFDMKIPSPKGKERWSKSAIDNLLTCKRYIPEIISMDKFLEVQFEKARRSNVDSVTGKKTTTRYNTQNTWSGLFVCAECGANYRRITRPNGEAVWRCANRVEHGKKICKQSPSIRESAIEEYVQKKMDIESARKMIEAICVHSDGHLVLKRNKVN